MASDDLRARIAEAMRGHYPIAARIDGTVICHCGATVQADRERLAIREHRADAVMALVQEELDQLRAERDRLSSGVLQLGAEAHRRKWAHDAGEDRFGNPISAPAFKELHRIGNELIALRNAKPQPTTKESR